MPSRPHKASQGGGWKGLEGLILAWVAANKGLRALLTPGEAGKILRSLLLVRRGGTLGPSQLTELAWRKLFLVKWETAPRKADKAFSPPGTKNQWRVSGTAGIYINAPQGRIGQTFLEKLGAKASNFQQCS